MGEGLSDAVVVLLYKGLKLNASLLLADLACEPSAQS